MPPTIRQVLTQKFSDHAAVIVPHLFTMCWIVGVAQTIQLVLALVALHAALGRREVIKAKSPALRARKDTPPSPPPIPPISASEPLLQKRGLEDEVLDPALYREGTWQMDAYRAYCKHLSAFWTPEEIKIGEDVQDFEGLDREEQDMVLTVLAFFYKSDGVVMENLAVNFSEEVPHMAIRAFYAVQEAIEAVHAETYAKMLQGLVGSDRERHTAALRRVETNPTISAKGAWASEWMSRDKPFAERLLAFGCFEAILFSLLFAHFDAYKAHKLFRGLTQANELISRDEGMHGNFACLVFGMLEDFPSLALDRTRCRRSRKGVCGRVHAGRPPP